MIKKILILIIFLIVFLSPKPCGRYTTAAVPLIEYKCYGIKTLGFSIGGGSCICWGICNLFEKKPSFDCTESGDCISGCGWRAWDHGCIAVNKNSKDYLEHNNLSIEERFPLVCYMNSVPLR